MKTHGLKMAHPNQDQRTLAELSCGKSAEILGFSEYDEEASMRLREMGFCEGDQVEVLHFGLWGRSPINVRLHNTFIAMRPDEAKRVLVKLLVET